jgi:hypothetical protein
VATASPGNIRYPLKNVYSKLYNGTNLTFHVQNYKVYKQLKWKKLGPRYKPAVFGTTSALNYNEIEKT